LANEFNAQFLHLFINDVFGCVVELE